MVPPGEQRNIMDSALLIHRLHFAFTVTFHYLFPQLTMGLAPLIIWLKSLALRNQDETYNQAARFWARIFGINFVLGVITGIPLEFEFGTNWSHFSAFAGGVIGQTLAMEGVFAFFLESAFLGLFLYGEKRLSPKMHWWSSVAVFVGSWLSGFFPVGLVAIRAQHERCGDHWRLRHGFDRRVLFAIPAAPGARAYFCEDRHYLRLDLQHLATVSHRRSPRKNGCGSSTGNAGRHGGAVYWPAGGTAGSDRPAGHGQASNR